MTAPYNPQNRKPNPPALPCRLQTTLQMFGQHSMEALMLLGVSNEIRGYIMLQGWKEELAMKKRPRGFQCVGKCGILGYRNKAPGWWETQWTVDPVSGSSVRAFCRTCDRNPRIRDGRPTGVH